MEGKHLWQVRQEVVDKENVSCHKIIFNQTMSYDDGYLLQPNTVWNIPSHFYAMNIYNWRFLFV